jgi:hypothetical protein
MEVGLPGGRTEGKEEGEEREERRGKSKKTRGHLNNYARSIIRTVPSYALFSQA